MVARPCVRSWARQNPAWRCEFLDDRAVDQFVRQNCSETEYSTFCSLPLAVMKADFWRYAVLRKHGGVYADIDSTSRVPIEEWTDDKAGLVTGVENTQDLRYFCQWVIAAIPGHPVLQNAIDLVIERAADGIDIRDPTAVHYYTGPQLWTDAILSYLKTPSNGQAVPSSIAAATSHEWGCAQSVFAMEEYWTARDIHIYDSPMLSTGAVAHMLGSLRWVTVPGYQSWRSIREEHCQQKTPQPN